MAGTATTASSGARLRAEAIEPADASYVTADDGARIYFELFAPTGESRQSHDVRPVLMVMGLGANGRLWAPAVRRTLAGGHPVITFDNRGCGRSSTPWRPWTTRTMAGDAVAVLDELGVAEAHVGAASLGGMVAQELALEFPERVRSLVLLATTGGFRQRDSVSPEGLLRVLETVLRSLRPASAPERQVRDFLGMAASEDFVAQCRPGDETWETVAAMLEHPASQRGVVLQILAAIRHSTWSRLPRLDVPVLVHHGTDDSLIPHAAGRELARRIPGARFELHPGAGHGLFERTDEVGEMIMAFLAECERRRN